MKHKSIKTAITYFVGIALSKMILILLLPLYTSKFDPSIMGGYDLVQSVLAIIAPVAFFQIWDAMFRFSFDDNSDSKRNIIIINSFFVLILGVVIFTSILLIINIFLNFDNLLLVYLNGIIIGVNYFYMFLTRIKLDNKLFTITGVINTIVMVITSLILILVFNKGISSLYYSMIFGGLIQIIIIEWKYKVISKIRFNLFSKDQIIKLIKFSFPLTVASGVYWLLTGYSKLFISINIGNYANGLYSVTNKFSVVILMIVSVIQFTWNESLYIQISEENPVYKVREKQEKEMNALLSLTILGTALCILGIKLIFPFFVNSSYLEAIKIIPHSIVIVMLSSFTGLVGTLFSANKKTQSVLWTTFISALVNIILLSVFKENLDLHGVLIISIISFLILFILRMISVRRLFGIKLYLNNIFPLLFLLFTIFCFYIFSNMLNFIIIIVSGITILFSYRKLLYKFSRGDNNEKNDKKN